MFLDTDKIIKCLAYVFREPTHLNRGDKCSTIEVRFSSEETARRPSDRTIIIGMVDLLPSYMERRKLSVWIEEMLPEVVVAWETTR